MTTERTARVSVEAVRETTGRDWDGWFAVLDAAGAAGLDHKGIVALLEREHPAVSGWWRQSITVEYEKARGKRVLGQTADAGFQVGVQRSFAAPIAEVWDLLVSRPELWLGDGASVRFTQGDPYDVPGATGEIRVVKPRDRIRMTWQPDGWAAPATVQLTVTTTPSGKTALNAHVEKLPDAAAREAMGQRWREALDRIASALS